MKRIGPAGFIVALTIVFSTMVAPDAQGRLRAFYPFDGDANDAGEFGVHGTLNGDAGFASGFEGSALDLDGDWDLVRIPLDIDATQIPKLTFGAWVKPRSLPPGGCCAPTRAAVISHDNGWYDRAVGMQVWPSLPVGWYAFNGNEGAAVVPVLPAEPATTWSFLAAVYDHEARTVRLYFDPDAASTDDELMVYGGTGAEDGGATETFIGASTVLGGSEFFDGLIDNVFFFDQALGAADVAAIRMGGAAALATFCGNGIVGVGERCDDGNLVAGDGCSDLCEQELPLPSDLYRCQAGLLKQAAALGNRLGALRRNCLLLQLRGKLPNAGIDCRAEPTLDPTTDTKLAAARASFDRKLRAACAGIEPSALGFPGSCDDADGPPFGIDELVDCVMDGHAESTRQLTALVAALP